MDNKFKHLDYIQSTIARMASNSFYLKGLSVSLIAALITLSLKESDCRVFICTLLLNIVFWFLDAYYLRQEKLFRELYNEVRLIEDDSNITFSMDTSRFQKKVLPIPCLMVYNISITPLYGSVAIILIVLIHMV